MTGSLLIDNFERLGVIGVQPKDFDRELKPFDGDFLASAGCYQAWFVFGHKGQLSSGG